MILIVPLIAQSSLAFDPASSSLKQFGLSFGELVALVGAAMLVTLPIVIWAVYFRKRKDDRHQHQHHHHHHSRRHRSHRHQSENSGRAEGGSDASATPLSSEDEGETDRDHHHHHRRRRRRRPHRPRNPTLAETGGLPPIRSQSSTPPATPPAA